MNEIWHVCVKIGPELYFIGASPKLKVVFLPFNLLFLIYRVLQQYEVIINVSKDRNKTKIVSESASLQTYSLILLFIILRISDSHILKNFHAEPSGFGEI